ncbi:MAG: ECF transporter S component, partial [Atribacterota bacterium]
IVLAGVLGSISVLLSLTPIGLIPVPNLSGSATTVHIPAIVAGIIGGPVVGALVGLVLAFSTMHLFFAMGINLIACFLPRIGIGVVAYYVWVLLKKGPGAVLVASIAATLTNTVGVLGFAVLLGNFSWQQVVPIMALNGSLELVFSTIIVFPLVKGLQRQFPQTELLNMKKVVTGKLS